MENSMEPMLEVLLTTWVKFFEDNEGQSYGEPMSEGFYWKNATTDWVGPFADPSEAFRDAEDFG